MKDMIESNNSSLPSRIQVGLRCRPPFQHELSWDGEFTSAIQFSSQSIHISPGRHFSQRSFSFDHMWPPTTSQEYIYNQAISPIVDHVLDGHDGNIIAYGQTGTGKTYTMGFLEPSTSSKDIGIIPRVFTQLFDARAKQFFHISVSFLQIYLEGVYDLLVSGSSESELPVRPTSDGSAFYVDGLQEYTVESLEEAEGLIGIAMVHRRLATTARNPTSSRSHTMLTITITQHKTISKLSLVDLAGSERPSAANSMHGMSFAAKEQAKLRLNEAKAINSSLSALGNVMASLSNTETVVRYRDSKLTKLLKGLLHGKHATFLIATIDGALKNLNETLSTLKFASRCKKITIPIEIKEGIKYKINVSTQTNENYFLKEMELHILYQEQIHKLKNALENELKKNQEEDDQWSVSTIDSDDGSYCQIQF